MTRFTRLCVLLLVAGRPALLAQSLSLGATGGLRATDDFQYAAISESRRYVVGPAATLALPLGFAVEFEALYRRQGYRTGWGSPLYTSSIREADNVWEFPLLARYRIPLRRIRPFAEAGWAPRTTHGAEDVSGSYLSQLNPTMYTYYTGRSHTAWPVTHGAVVGGGIQFAAGRLEFAPEVRYTHWNQQNISGWFPDGPSYGSAQDQLDILLRISLRLAGRATN
jgi:hypothetical protein